MHHRLLATIAAAGLIALLVPSCAGDMELQNSTDAASSGASTSGASTSGGSGGQGQTGGTNTSGSSSGSSGGTPVAAPVLAVSQIFLGNTNPDSTTDDPNAWKQYGFDIDRVTTSNDFQGHCKPRLPLSGGVTFPDGNNGIDNSFGKNILPLLNELPLKVVGQDDINNRIKSGTFTFMLQFVQLDPGPDQKPLTTNLFEGAQTKPPAFDGTDQWPVRRASLMDPTDINTPSVVFDQSVLAGNTWTSGEPKDVRFTLEFLGAPISVTMHRARGSFNLADDHESAVSGQIGGVLDTAEIMAVSKQVIFAVEPLLCDLLGLELFLKQVEQASDIMRDGTQDPNADCNGISIGLGFKMKKVNLGPIAQAPQPTEGSCP